MKKQKIEAKDRVYLLANGKTPLTYSLANKHTNTRPLLVIDEESQRQRAIRYARNQKSQFVDEQDEHVIVEPIIFQDGKLVVPKVNFQLQEFLSMHPDNVSNNGSRFYEYNPEEESRREMEQMDMEFQAWTAVKNLDFDKLKTLASLLMNLDVDNMSSSEIRHNMVLYARDYPEDILDAIEDPNTEVDAIAKRAIDDGYVFVKGGKDLHYNLKTNKTKIFTIKHGMTAQDSLSQWLQSDVGLEFYELLREKFSTEE